MQLLEHMGFRRRLVFRLTPGLAKFGVNVAEIANEQVCFEFSMRVQIAE